MLCALLFLTAELYLLIGANSSGPAELTVSFLRYDGTNSILPVLKLKNTGSKAIVFMPTRIANQLAQKEFDQWETNYFYYLKLEGNNADYRILEPSEGIEAVARVSPCQCMCRFGVRFRPLEFQDRLPQVIRGKVNWVSYWCRRIVAPGSAARGTEYLEAWSPDIRDAPQTSNF